MQCDNARSLIPSYQDGELSEEQAAPLRAHLMECGACREVAKAETALKRWFVASPAPAVPDGFAAHVARRAFAGDPGMEALPEKVLTPARPQQRETPILPFVLRSTAAAAMLLIFLSMALHWRQLPASGDLEAQSMGASSELSDLIKELNEAEEQLSSPAASSELEGDEFEGSPAETSQ